MNVNLILKQFDELTDSEAMILSFKEFNPLLIDSSDIIRVEDDSIQIKSESGTVVVDYNEINGFKVLSKSDIVRMFILNMCGE